MAVISTKTRPAQGHFYDENIREDLANLIREQAKRLQTEYARFVATKTAAVKDALKPGEPLPKLADGKHIPTREALDEWREICAGISADATASIDAMKRGILADKFKAPSDALAVLDMLEGCAITTDDLVDAHAAIGDTWLVSKKLNAIAKEAGIDNPEMFGSHPYDHAGDALDKLAEQVRRVFSPGFSAESAEKQVRTILGELDFVLAPFVADAILQGGGDAFNAIAKAQAERIADAANDRIDNPEADIAERIQRAQELEENIQRARAEIADVEHVTATSYDEKGRPVKYYDDGTSKFGRPLDETGGVAENPLKYLF